MKSRNKENLKPSSTLKPIKPSPALKPSVSAGLPKQSESIVPMQIPTQPQMNGVAQTDVAINTEPSVAVRVWDLVQDSAPSVAVRVWI